MNRFDRDTALRRIAPGSYEGRIDRGWWIHAGPNGGYLAALLLRGMMLEVDDAERAPRSLTVHFLSRADEGPAGVSARIERRGRSLSSVSARLEQGERTIALALAAFSTTREGPEWSDALMPEVKPPEACERGWSDSGSSAPFRERFDTRPAIGAAPFEGSPHAHGGGWIRATDPRAPDPLLIAALADAWPPSLMSRFESRVEWRGAPTIDLTVHFRSPLPESQRKPDTFLLGVYRTREVSGGFMEEDGEIWTRDGTLLAQSRQLAVFA